MNKNLEYLIKRYQEFPEVDAICLGGSRARSANLNDDASDYDVYIYLNKPLSKEKRIEVLDRPTKNNEINLNFNGNRSGNDVIVCKKFGLFRSNRKKFVDLYMYNRCYCSYILSCIISCKKIN